MVSDVVVVALGAAVGILSLWRLPKQWRGDDHVRRDPPDGFPLSPRAWRAVLRSAPAVLAGWWLGVALVAVDVFAGRTAATDALVTVLALALLADLVVVVGVVLVNRPSSVVPPPLRDAPGLLRDDRRTARDR